MISTWKRQFLEGGKAGLVEGGKPALNARDAFFVFFDRARDAVAAAAAAGQRALTTHSWRDEVQVRVRMGLHTCEPYPSNQSYVGVGVHRAARICTVAHGGQVLLARSTAGIVADLEIPGVDVRDLGEQPAQGHRPSRANLPARRRGPAERLPAATDDQSADFSQGTVTTVYADVKGITRLIRELGSDDFGALLRDYQALLRRVLEEMGAGELELVLDSAVGAFATAKQAALAAAASQRAVAAHEWPRGLKLPLAVALHSEEAGVGWVGPAVVRCDSLCKFAQGGQIVLSQAVSSLLEEKDLGELSVQDLGVQSVEGFERPMRVYELVVPAVAET